MTLETGIRARFITGAFLGEDYRVFDNVIIRTEYGSTQIDHVIVSRYGLFVVKTCNRIGSISGDSAQTFWTQVVSGWKYLLQNPLRQNFVRIRRLAEFLAVPPDRIHSLVVFPGPCRFMESLPDNVIKSDPLGADFKRYIRSKTLPLLSPAEVDHICSALVRLKNGAGFLAEWYESGGLGDRLEPRRVTSLP